MPHPLDTENMEQMILDSPKQFREGLVAAQETPWTPPAEIRDVLYAGMGGSAMGGALLAEAGLNRVPIVPYSAYGLPPFATEHTLVVASSYSGNTEETLTVYDAARERGLPIVGTAAGGSLEEKCREDKVPFITIPANPPTMQPRSATGYAVGILGALLERAGLAADDTAARLDRLPAFLEDVMPTARERGERLANDSPDATPVIYASSAYPNVARIVKIKINENAKTPAFWNVFPELNHNEMTGWIQPQGPFHIIIFADPDDHPRVRRRMDITAGLLRDRGVRVTLLPIDGASRLEKIFSTLLVGDWMSYRLALELGTDPSPVAMVEDLKKRLEE